MQTCNFIAIGKNPAGETVVQFTPLGTPIDQVGSVNPGSGLGYVTKSGMLGVYQQWGEISLHTFEDLAAARAAAAVL